MTKSQFIRAASLAMTLSAGSAAMAGILVPVPEVPNSTDNYVFSINDNGVLTGSYTDQQFQEHGLFGTLDGNYTFFDYNGHVSTQGRSINKDGEIAGWAFQRKAPWFEFQFVRNPDGTITTTTLRDKRMKGSGRPGAFTDNGQIIGYYEALRRDGSYSPPRGLYGHGANYERRIVLPFPGMGGIFATGVNNKGDVAGFFESCPGCDGVHGFVVKDEVATQIDYPDEHVISTAIYGINDADLAIGNASYDDDVQITFLYDLRKNRFKRLDVDVAYSISDGGLIAVHNDGAPYIYCLTRETCPGGGARGIEVHDRWIPGAAAPIAVPCDHHCLKPM